MIIVIVNDCIPIISITSPAHAHPIDHPPRIYLRYSCHKSIASPGIASSDASVVNRNIGLYSIAILKTVSSIVVPDFHVSSFFSPIRFR